MSRAEQTTVDECEHLCQLLLININTIDTADTHTWYLAFSLVEMVSEFPSSVNFAHFEGGDASVQGIFFNNNEAIAQWVKHGRFWYM